ncbi:cupin domain-containing protein [Wenjunlia tyrosinilytica]|uniref:Cupin n=1 Tax=Wenjunlia tyrosinilytica TaxID=1544741 RepID=A0A917ZXM5_9ACTN|nr:cupin domain-containing protein [Wenjunlia tyrosinilytica]GGO97283.1 cupin [Wenjunlia tyrosinilytica]
MSSPCIGKIRAGDVTPNRARGGEVRVLLSPRTAQASSGFLGTLTLDPGESTREHYHPYSEEFLYLVSGSVLLHLENQSERLEPGDAVLVPKYHRHRLVNNGAEAASVVFCCSPLAPKPELGHVDTDGGENSGAGAAAARETTR